MDPCTRCGASTRDGNCSPLYAGLCADCGEAISRISLSERTANNCEKRSPADPHYHVSSRAGGATLRAVAGTYGEALRDAVLLAREATPRGGSAAHARAGAGREGYVVWAAAGGPVPRVGAPGARSRSRPGEAAAPCKGAAGNAGTGEPGTDAPAALPAFDRAAARAVVAVVTVTGPCGRAHRAAHRSSPSPRSTPRPAAEPTGRGTVPAEAGR